ncbi:MAG TPA: TRAP transporter small permease, partial [Gammaproteobacteria bacterium]|nr:TRAP transporter small permease [Gammaproteobacteria bacterium]
MSERPRFTGVLRWLVALDRAIEALEATVLVSSILLMAAMTIANVIGRDVFDHSLIFADEVNQILIILTTFLGI